MIFFTYSSFTLYDAHSYKVMFCRVCGSRLRFWESYRIPGIGYWYGSVRELTEVPGIVARAYRTQQKFRAGTKDAIPVPGYCGTGRTEQIENPGTGMNEQQNSQKFRARV